MLLWNVHEGIAARTGDSFRMQQRIHMSISEKCSTGQRESCTQCRNNSPKLDYPTTHSHRRRRARLTTYYRTDGRVVHTATSTTTCDDSRRWRRKRRWGGATRTITSRDAAICDRDLEELCAGLRARDCSYRGKDGLNSGCRNGDVAAADRAGGAVERAGFCDLDVYAAVTSEGEALADLVWKTVVDVLARTLCD